MGGQGSGRKAKYPQSPIMNIKLLWEIGKDRGFRTRSDLCKYLAEKASYTKTEKHYYTKLTMRVITYRDILLISDALALTPSEFLAVWFPNTFQSEDGQMIFKMPDEVRYMVVDQLITEQQLSLARNGKDHHQNRTVKVQSEIADFLKEYK